MSVALNSQGLVCAHTGVRLPVSIASPLAHSWKSHRVFSIPLLVLNGVQGFSLLNGLAGGVCALVPYFEAPDQETGTFHHTTHKLQPRDVRRNASFAAGGFPLPLQIGCLRIRSQFQSPSVGLTSPGLFTGRQPRKDNRGWHLSVHSDRCYHLGSDLNLQLEDKAHFYYQTLYNGLEDYPANRYWNPQSNRTNRWL